MGRRPTTRSSGIRKCPTKGQEIVEFKPPRSAYHETIKEFLALAEVENVSLPGFDWQAWSSTVEAQQLCLGGEWVARASRAELFRLITQQVRKGSFVEGSLEEAAQSGLLDAITSRLRALDHKD